MIKRLMITVLVLSGLFITAAKADEFTVLDHVTFTRPFSSDVPIFAEFSSPASAKSIELTIHFNNVIPDGCCAATRYSIRISLEGKDPTGNWHTLVWDEKSFDDSIDTPIRVFMLARSLAPLSGQTDFMGSREHGVKVSYMFGELPRDLRIKFTTGSEPFDPPRPDDLVSFTVSVSGRMFSE